MESDLVANPRTEHPLVDGHTHIDQFALGDIPGLLERARGANIGLIIAAGTTVSSVEAILHLADHHPLVHAGVGLHPADLVGWLDDKTVARLNTLAMHPKVVEWSETGLDYMPGSPPYDLQQDAFRKQIRLARELNLPLVIHSREADDDTLRLLAEEKATEVGGAWHYFQGDRRLAEKVIEMGFLVSLAKPLLRLPQLQASVEHIPLSHIVIETDSYPQPFKKNPVRRTEPWHLPQVAEMLAELHRTDLEAIAEVTTSNYLRMLNGRIDPDSLPLPIDRTSA